MLKFKTSRQQHADSEARAKQQKEDEAALNWSSTPLSPKPLAPTVEEEALPPLPKTALAQRGIFSYNCLFYSQMWRWAPAVVLRLS